MKRLDTILEAHLPPDVLVEVKEEMARRARAFGFAEGVHKLRRYAESAIKLADQVEEIMWHVADEDLDSLQTYISKMCQVHEFYVNLNTAVALEPFARKPEVTL